MSSSRIRPRNLTLKPKSYDQESINSGYFETILWKTTFELNAHGSADFCSDRDGICLRIIS